MKALAVLAAKDLRRRLADPAGLLLNLGIPLAIAGMMALAFGGSAGSTGNRAPILRLVLVDEDATPLSEILAGSSQNKEAAERLSVLRAETREAGLELMRDSDAAAMFVVPKGFAAALLDGVPAKLELVKNPSQVIMPEVASHGAGVVALYITVGRRFLGEDAARLKSLIDGQGWDDAAGLTVSLLALYQRVKASDELLFPPLISLEEESAGEEESGGGFNMMGWMYPGLLVMGLMFVATSQMRDLLRERDAGTLRRQLCAPVGAGQILAAKMISVAITVLAAHAILMAIGTLAFGLRWGNLLVLALVSCLVVLAVTGFAALLFSLVRTERQGDAVAGVVIMVMSLLGGSFVPPQIMPEALRAASRATVNYWGQEALRALSAGQGWQGARGYAGGVAALALVFTIGGATLLRWRHMRGSL